MKYSQVDLSNELEIEYMRNEKRRVIIIILVFLASIVAVPLLQILAPNSLMMGMERKEGLVAISICYIIFFLFEVGVFLRINYMLKRKFIPPFNYRIINTIIEFTLPGLILYFSIIHDQSTFIMEHDGYGFYILLIILAVLHLDWRISILAGVISCLGYGIVSYWVLHYFSIENTLQQLQITYYARSISLLIFGIISGLVANEMDKTIKKAINYRLERRQFRQVLSEQVSSEVANELIKTGDKFASHVVDASIMFMDIKDFSKWADSRSPEDVMEFQNAIFCPIIEIINKHHGIVNQILGDGFMASFGIAKNQPDYVQHAFDAGIDILNKIKELEKSGTIKETYIRIGLHRGNIVTGNIGNKIRKQFSLAGKNIIVAARLEQINKEIGSQYLISEDIKERIKTDIELDSLGLFKMKGIDKKIEVFKVC